MSSVYIVVDKGKSPILVGPDTDPLKGLDRVFRRGIIPPAYQKDIFTHCEPASSSLSCDIARAIVSTMRFVYPSRKFQEKSKSSKR